MKKAESSHVLLRKQNYDADKMNYQRSIYKQLMKDDSNSTSDAKSNTSSTKMYKP